MCGLHSSYQYSLFGQIGFVDIFVEYKSLQKVIMMTTTLQVYVCRIRESQSCGFGSEETCSRQRFSLWARDRPGLNKSFEAVERFSKKHISITSYESKYDIPRYQTGLKQRRNYLEAPIITIFRLIGLNLNMRWMRKQCRQ